MNAVWFWIPEFGNRVRKWRQMRQISSRILTEREALTNQTSNQPDEFTMSARSRRSIRKATTRTRRRTTWMISEWGWGERWPFWMEWQSMSGSSSDRGSSSRPRASWRVSGAWAPRWSSGRCAASSLWSAPCATPNSAPWSRRRAAPTPIFRSSTATSGASSWCGSPSSWCTRDRWPFSCWHSPATPYNRCTHT